MFPFRAARFSRLHFAFFPKLFEKSPRRLGNDRLDRKTQRARNGAYQMHNDVDRSLLTSDAREDNSRLTGNSENMAEVTHALIRREVLYDLINSGSQGNSRLDLQAAPFFPRLAVHPADFAEDVPVAPAFNVDVNREDGLDRAVQHDLKIKRLHGGWYYR